MLFHLLSNLNLLFLLFSIYYVKLHLIKTIKKNISKFANNRCKLAFGGFVVNGIVSEMRDGKGL